MIQSYEIRRINKEEVLCVHINFNSEFAKLNAKKKKKKLKDTIEKYIKDNNIKFAGKKVAIIAGGIMLGTILINAPKTDGLKDVVSPQTIAIVQDFDELNMVEKNNHVSEEKVEDKEEIKEVKEDTSSSIKKVETKSSKSTNKSTSTTNKTTSKSSTAKTTTSSSVKSSNSNGNSTTNNTISSSKASTPVDNNTYVTIYRSSGSVLKIELEEYIIGVVGAEMPASFNIEALKAQAILARTYAIKALSKKTKLTDTSSTQNYKDNNELKKIWGSSFNTYYNKIKKAVDSTKGMYLTYKGEAIEAVYHSTSNGKTEDAKNVWGNSFPYLVSVDSPYDTTNKSFLYSTNFDYSSISSKLGVNVTKNTVINIISRTEGDRVGIIEIAGKNFTGVEVRTLLGLRSADFSIELLDTEVKITTKGFGHGSGMSQYGANGMASNGYTYTQILKHYYPGVTLSKM